MTPELRERVAAAIDRWPRRFHFVRLTSEKDGWEVMRDTDPSGPIGDDTFQRVFFSKDENDCYIEQDRLDTLAKADTIAPIFAEVEAAAVERCAAYHDTNAANAKLAYERLNRYSEDNEEREEREGWRAWKDAHDRHRAYAAAIRAQNKEKP